MAVIAIAEISAITFLSCQPFSVAVQYSVPKLSIENGYKFSFPLQYFHGREKYFWIISTQSFLEFWNSQTLVFTDLLNCVKESV